MKVKVGDQEVDLNPKYLEVREETLNDFLRNFAGIYNYYNTMAAKAQFVAYLTEDRYDQISMERYQFYKENGGGSDKFAESKAAVCEHVVKAKRNARETKYISQLIANYLRSLDKAHEDALNLGYNVRKEIDKLFPQTIQGADNTNSVPNDIDAAFEKMFQG